MDRLSQGTGHIGLDVLDNSSNKRHMEQPLLSRHDVETVAEKIGATRALILKWRQRGIPGDWALRIAAASDGKISAADMVAFDQARTVGVNAVRAELERETAGAAA